MLKLEARHLPPTLKTPHPYLQPTANTYPSEVHSKEQTSPVRLSYGLGTCTVWVLELTPTSEGKLVNSSPPLSKLVSQCVKDSKKN